MITWLHTYTQTHTDWACLVLPDRRTKIMNCTCKPLCMHSTGIVSVSRSNPLDAADDDEEDEEEEEEEFQ